MKDNLNWVVEKQPLITDKGIATKWYATVRTDTNRPLGCVSKDYQVFQNSQLLELVETVCKSKNYEIVGNKEIKEGEKVLVQVGNGSFNFKGDTFFNYLSVFNSFTGKNKLGVTFSNSLVSCENQFYNAPEQGRFCFSHTSSLEENLTKMLSIIDGVEKEQTRFYDFMESFYNIEIDNDKAVELLYKLKEYDPDTEEKTSTRMINLLDEMMECIDLEMGNKGMNLYGWFNGITYWATYKSSKGAFEGQGLLLSNKAFKLCKSLI